MGKMDEKLEVLQRLYDASGNLDPFNYEGRQEKADQELGAARREAKAFLEMRNDASD